MAINAFGGHLGIASPALTGPQLVARGQDVRFGDLGQALVFERRLKGAFKNGLNIAQMRSAPLDLVLLEPQIGEIREQRRLIGFLIRISHYI